MTESTRVIHRAVFSDLSRAHEAVTLVGDEARHLARVRRAREGERVELLDLGGRAAVGAIGAIGGSRQRPELTIRVERVETRHAVRPVITLAGAVPKGERLDWMVDQLTQLGVAAWLPLICERSERDPGSLRRDRLERLVVAACKQSGRAHAMRIGDAITPDEALACRGAVVCDAAGHDALGEIGRDATLLVGPEGGWSEAERAVIERSGVPVRRLGAHVLRVETAAVGAAAIVLSGAAPERAQQ